MADKQTKLSIVIRTVDQATAKINAINARLDAVTKPIRDFKKSLSDMRSKSGLDDVIGGFQGVGNAIAGVLAKVAMIGGVAGAAVAGLFSLVDGFDDLGDKAESMGVSVDFLAQMRYAAESSGAAVESLDSGMQGFSSSLGMARAGTGKLAGFLKLVSPELLKQLKAAKGNEEAFGLLADAMAKIEDPAKRAAFAQKTLGDASLAPLLAKGSKGIKELREEHFKSAGSMEEAAKAAGGTDDALKKLKASTDGVKAALVTGLAPALTIIVQKLATWFTAHRADIAEWAAQIGEKLPGAVQKVVEWIGKAYDKVSAFVERIGGLKTVAIAAAAIIVGPLLASLVSLAGALVTAGTAMAGLFSSTRVAGFIGMIKNATTSMLGLGAATGKAGGGGGGKLGALAGAAGSVALPIAIAVGINEATGGSFEDQARARGWKGEDGDLFGPNGVMRFMKDVSSQAKAATGSAGRSTETSVKIELANAPPGTRVSTDPKSTGDVDLSVGYQMGFAL